MIGTFIRILITITATKFITDPDKLSAMVSDEKVIPVRGSILYCDYAMGNADHSGIYLDKERIVQLNGDGQIVAVNAQKFVDNPLAWESTIYVSSYNGKAIGSSLVANRAEAMIGRRRDYNILLDNCHQFTAGCVLDDFENADNFLWTLKYTVSEEMNSGKSVQWLEWDYQR